MTGIEGKIIQFTEAAEQLSTKGRVKTGSITGAITIFSIVSAVATAAAAPIAGEVLLVIGVGGSPIVYWGIAHGFKPKSAPEESHEQAHERVNRIFDDITGYRSEFRPEICDAEHAVDVVQALRGKRRPSGTPYDAALNELATGLDGVAESFLTDTISFYECAIPDGFAQQTRDAQESIAAVDAQKIDGNVVSALKKRNQALESLPEDHSLRRVPAKQDEEVRRKTLKWVEGKKGKGTEVRTEVTRFVNELLAVTGDNPHDARFTFWLGEIDGKY